MSDLGEDVYTASQPVNQGLNTTVPRDLGIVAASRPIYDPRKFPFDTGNVASISVRKWSATKADRMSAVEAGAKLSDLMRMFKVERQEPDFCAAFFNSLMFCLAVNSSSVLTPDRAEFEVGDTKFKLLDVIMYLGSDLRRFFRAYADETVEILKAVLNHPDRFDSAVRDKRDLIDGVARDRNLVRYPYLIGDNAEACNSLASVEHVAVAAAKQSKLESVINVADRLKTSANTHSFGAFDSTNGEFLAK